ncbi:putative orf protein [Hibiscus syriacus]|uniref:Orf protein n=1 Tax=Hibiscus syriacus TaxID=106335 RepID=A0A6A3BA03_HIBSY|nr:putative orf protein [Hibiscus syriacus]
MDWYHCNGMEDLVVPKHQEVDDNLPSPDSWSKWDFTSPGNFNDECFAVAENLTYDKPKFNGRLCHSVNSNPQPMLTIRLHVGVYMVDCRRIRLEFRSIKPVTSSMISADSSSSMTYSWPPYWKIRLGAKIFTNRFALLLDSSARPWQLTIFCKMHLLPKFWSPEQITANGFVSEGMSLEESVLNELEMVTTQLSDKTRICFRDAFYRLANNSKQNPVALDKQGNLHAQTHQVDNLGGENKVQLVAFYYNLQYFQVWEKGKMESETNTIDRTIANLTFDKMDANLTVDKMDITFGTFRFANPNNSKQKCHQVAQNSHAGTKRCGSSRHGYASRTDANNSC